MLAKYQVVAVQDNRHARTLDYGLVPVLLLYEHILVHAKVGRGCVR
jgi:hypothetical protein